MTPKDTATKDPGRVGDEAARAVEVERAEATSTSRRTGYNSRGEPELYASDIESIQNQYALTRPEAEDFWSRTIKGNEDPDSVASSLVSNRVVYRVHYEQVANSADHALTAVQVAAAKQAEGQRVLEEKALARSGAITTPTSDRTQPEAGPYGPYANYKQTALSVEEVAHAADLTPDQVREAGLTTTEGK